MRTHGDIPLIQATALTLKLALATAQRIGEVCGIALSELDLNDTAPIWTLPAVRAKNDRPNRVPRSPIALQLVREAMMLSPGSKWLFPSRAGKGAIDPHAPTKAIERAPMAIGLSDFRIHDQRRTAATRMAEMGIAPHTISLILNHVSARNGTITSKVYVQYSYDREKREALNAWGLRLERIVAGLDASNVVSLTLTPLYGGMSEFKGLERF